MSNKLESISGQIRKIIFSNKDNFFQVLAVENDFDEYIVSGNFELVEEGNMYEFEGSFVEHPKYGVQFKAIHSKHLLPTQEAMVIDYLSSSRFIGIGPKLAKKIYDIYQCDNIFEEILDNPSLLRDIKGLSLDKANKILATLQETSQENGLFHFLSKHNIEYSEVASILNKSMLNVNDFIKILQDNPYLLLGYNCNFKEIDNFAARLEVEDFNIKRNAGYVLYTIKNITFRTGSTYIESNDLIQLLKIDEDTYNSSIQSLLDNRLIVVENNNVFERQQYDSEQFINQYIKEQLSKEIKTNNIDSFVTAFEDHHGIVFDEVQKSAINEAIDKPFSIITGGPGTGKSTIVYALIDIIKKIHPSYYIGLCAPTGKASKRLSELTNQTAITIHKMLKFDLHTQEFNHNIFNPLDYDVLIIDEASMIDSLLFASLLKASMNVKKIIILGDYNQLPSVAQGQILHDMVESKVVCTTKLKYIYRQSEGSKIIDLAYKILNYENVSEEDVDNKDIKFLNLNNTSQVMDILSDYSNNLKIDDIQSLAPMYKGRYGIDNINDFIQLKLFKTNENQYNIGDRIIQLKNRNEDEIYNGDIGEIVSISNTELVVLFDDRYITYNNTQKLDIRLAYCLSVHKAQGNEYDEVIVFIDSQNMRFINNKLLYTAITRAKKKLVIVSKLSLINECIQNKQVIDRKSTLKSLLCE